MDATLVAGTNLYIFISNRKKDEIKERLEKLYTQCMFTIWNI